MLTDAKIYAVLPARDLAGAKEFYKSKLGLEPAREVPGGVLYECGGGTMFQLYETDNAGTAHNTAMGWSVDDLDDTMTDLGDRGVEFEVYDDMPGVDKETGVASMDGIRAVWFKDSEGNILCLSELS